MFEAVHARPDGESTVGRHAATAAEYGFDGIVVRNHDDVPDDYDPAVVGERFGIEVVDGVEIRADSPSAAAGHVGTRRPETTIVLVRGGTVAINRFAVEADRVDVLAHPMRGEGDLNHVLARAAAENGVRLEFDVGPVLRGHGGRRVRAIADLRKQRELVEQYDVPYVVSSTPSSHLEVRAPRELVAVGELLGFDPGDVESGLREWGRIAQRNRERRSESFIEPGVERDRDEAADR